MTATDIAVRGTDARPGQAGIRLVLATARVYLLNYASNPVLIIRAPIGPVLYLLAFYLAYVVSDQRLVGGTPALAFLVIGMLGTLAWDATVWGAGNALQSEIYQGTVSSVVAAPGRLSAVILGHGLGSLVFGMPALAVCLAVSTVLGVRFQIGDPLAAVLSVGVVYACCMCIGIAFAGLFILSRQSNALSNFLQMPVYLLAGFFVPREALPGWAQDVGGLLPLTHAISALRRSALLDASLTDIGGDLLTAAGTSAIFLLVGVWGLHRVDVVLRRRATLDLL